MAPSGSSTPTELGFGRSGMGGVPPGLPTDAGSPSSDGPSDLDDEIWLVDVESGGARMLPLESKSSNTHRTFAWSPTASRLAVITDGNLSVVDIARGGERQLATDVLEYAESPVWSHDGGRIAVSSDDDIWAIDAERGTTTRITQGLEYGSYNTGATWDPLGRSVQDVGGAPVSPMVRPQSILVDGTIAAPGEVRGLSADGGRVAIRLAPTEHGCAEFDVWEPAAALDVEAIRPIVACPSDPAGGLRQFALADTRVTWVSRTQTNHINWYINTATVDRPREVDVRPPFISNDVEYRFSLAADRDLVALGFQDRDRTDPAELWRLDGERGTRLRLNARIRSLSVDSGQIAVAHASGDVTVRRPNGTLSQRFRFAPKSVRAAAIDDSHLVVLMRNRILAYGLQSGQLERAIRVPQKAILKDVCSDIAVYRLGTAVHAVSLTDGRDVVVASPKVGPVHAQIEESGLFYSYTEPGAELKGRVVFVPFDELVERMETP